MEKFSESFQTIRAFFCIAFDFYGNYGLVLAENEIHFVIALSPVEYLKTTNKCLTDEIGANSGLKDMSLCFAVSKGLLKSQTIINHFKRIVVHLQFRNTCFTPGLVNAVFL